MIVIPATNYTRSSALDARTLNFRLEKRQRPMKRPPNDLPPEPEPPTVGRRPCPICGDPMFMVSIEPTDKRDYEQRTFECARCAYGETMVVNFRKS